MAMGALDCLTGGKVVLWKETFAVVKSKNAHPRAFAMIVDKKEMTVIVDQALVDERDVISIERDWKLFTFDMVLPFGLVGFLAAVSTALADEGISIFAVSSYSTDHILVKKKDVAKAVKRLEALGCVVKK